jgi:flagellar protein FliL
MAAAAAAAATPADVTDEVVGAVEGAEAPEGGKTKKKKLSKKKLMMLGGALLLVLGLGGGAVMMGLPAMILGGEEVADGEHAAEEEEHAEESVGVFFDMPEMLVNLSTNGKKLGFLKLKVALELADEEAQHKVEAVLPRIVDTFQTYLRGLRIEDLNGSAGLYRLREELLLRVGAAVKPVEVKDVLFKEMLVQ